MLKNRIHAGLAAAATVLAALSIPSLAQADGHSAERLTVYFTRHAEKKTVTTNIGAPTIIYTTDADGNFIENTAATTQEKGSNLNEVCGESKCAEVLSGEGELRASLLAQWFHDSGIARKVDAVYATHKTRTQQTVTPLATSLGLDVMQLPSVGTELNPESTTPSECATLEAIEAARFNSDIDTIVVAGHSGTLYDIMGSFDELNGTGVKDCGALTGLGLNTGNTVPGTGDTNRFPKDSKGKVADFGDLWKVVIKRDGTARFVWRKRLDPLSLHVDKMNSAR